ncbi:hypothetical protein [Armatimonas sp.]|uniref:hypothetical protein n=1 Tax=Armatimonas sp. TaxID=1872638 RepID=UPI00286C257F|nr:hypothetical protein [Armatimonas sp.]
MKNIARLLAPLLIGKPARISLAELVSGATFIARARVTHVGTTGQASLEPLGLQREVRYADAVVIEPFKNTKKGQKMRFLAEGTWTCDSSTALKGETVLLFLGKWEGDLKSGEYVNPKLYPGMLQLELSGRGRIEIERGMVTPGLIYDLGRYFPRPKGVEKYESFSIPLADFEKTVQKLLRK